MTGQNLYELLGVSKGASPREIRQAYIRRVKECHPDQFNPQTQRADWERANETLKHLNEAHETLRDPVARAKYDRPIPKNPPREPSPNRPQGPPTPRPPQPQNTHPPKRTPNPPPPQKPPPSSTGPEPNPHPKKRPHANTRFRSRLDRMQAGSAAFDSLPRSAKKRLLSRIHGRDRSQFALKLHDVTWHTVGSILLGLWFLFLLTDLSAPLWKNERVYFLAAASVVIAAAQALLLRHVILWHQSPLRSWLIISQLYVIRTHLNKVRFWPLSKLSDLHVTPSYTNGKYSHTSIQLRFGNQLETVRIPDALSSEMLVSTLEFFVQQLQRSKQNEDWSYFWKHDDFRNYRPDMSLKPALRPSYGIALVSLTFSLMAFATGFLWQGNPHAPQFQGEPESALIQENSLNRFTTSYVLENSSLAEDPPPADPAPETKPAATPKTGPRRASTAKNQRPAEPLGNWKNLHDESLSWLERGQLERALEATNKALHVAQQTVGEEHPDYASSLFVLSKIYSLRGRLDEAKSLAEKSLSIREKNPTHPDLPAALTNLASILANQGETKQAEALHRKAIESWDAIAPDSPGCAQSLEALADLLVSLHQTSPAEPLLLRALKIREKSLGPKNPALAANLNNLAEFYRTQGKHTQAVPLYERALTIWEESLGEDHPDVAALLNNLALLYSSQKMFPQAEALFKRALAIQEKALGPDHPDVTGSLNNLANLYHSRGKFALAEPLLLRSIEIREKALGFNHPDVAATLHNLGALYHAQGLFIRSEQVFLKALAVLEQSSASDDLKIAQCLQNLGLVYIAQNQIPQAELRLQRALALLDQSLGPNHPDAAPILDKLASLYKNTGRPSEAAEAQKRASQIRSASR